jgi:hypothetical protein
MTEIASYRNPFPQRERTFQDLPRDYDKENSSILEALREESKVERSPEKENVEMASRDSFQCSSESRWELLTERDLWGTNLGSSLVVSVGSPLLFSGMMSSSEIACINRECTPTPAADQRKRSNIDSKNNPENVSRKLSQSTIVSALSKYSLSRRTLASRSRIRRTQTADVSRPRENQEKNNPATDRAVRVAFDNSLSASSIPPLLCDTKSLPAVLVAKDTNKSSSPAPINALKSPNLRRCASNSQNRPKNLVLRRSFSSETRSVLSDKSDISRDALSSLPEDDRNSPLRLPPAIRWKIAQSKMNQRQHEEKRKSRNEFPNRELSLYC